MNKTQDHQRIQRVYDVDINIYKWIKNSAKDGRRPVIRQVEIILEQAYEAHKKGEPNGQNSNN